MNIHSFALASVLTSATALSAFAADTIKEDGTSYEDAAKVSGNYVYDTDTYEVGGQTYMNVGGEIRGENEAVADDDGSGQASRTAETSAENIIAAAEVGTIVSSSDDIQFGTVTYTQEMSNGYRVFVAIDPAAEIEAGVIGFDVSALEVKTVGTGLEYSNTLEMLRERVADKS